MQHSSQPNLTTFPAGLKIVKHDQAIRHHHGISASTSSQELRLAGHFLVLNEALTVKDPPFGHASRFHSLVYQESRAPELNKRIFSELQPNPRVVVFGETGLYPGDRRACPGALVQTAGIP